LLDKEGLKRKYGRRVAQNIGIVVVATKKGDDSHGNPVSLNEIVENGLAINFLCAGALMSNGGRKVFVVFQKNWTVEIIEYFGKPIFKNPMCCGRSVKKEGGVYV